MDDAVDAGGGEGASAAGGWNPLEPDLFGFQPTTSLDGHISGLVPPLSDALLVPTPEMVRGLSAQNSSPPDDGSAASVNRGLSGDAAVGPSPFLPPNLGAGVAARAGSDIGADVGRQIAAPTLDAAAKSSRMLSQNSAPATRDAAELILPSLGQGAVEAVGNTEKGLATLNERRQMLWPFWDLYQNFDNLSPKQQQDAILAVRRATIPSYAHPVDPGIGGAAATAEWQPPRPRRPYLTEGLARWLIWTFQEQPKEERAKTFDEFAGPPPERSGLYQQGDSLNRSVASWVTEEERAKHPFATGIPYALGSGAVGIGATAIGTALGQPEAGLLIGAGTMGLGMAAEQYDRALAVQAKPPLANPGTRALPNIDLGQRPVVHNADGTISTLAPIAINLGDTWVLVPTIAADGRVMSSDEAAVTYDRSGQHLGIFDSRDAADAYAHQLHRQQEWLHGMDAELQRTQAAREAFVDGTLLGGVPLGAILRPIERVAPGILPWLSAKALQYRRSAPVFLTVGEAQAWLSQQIARENYDPNAEYSPDATRMATSLAIASLGTAVPTRVREGRADTPSTTPRPGTDANGSGEAYDQKVLSSASGRERAEARSARPSTSDSQAPVDSNAASPSQPSPAGAARESGPAETTERGAGTTLPTSLAAGNYSSRDIPRVSLQLRQGARRERRSAQAQPLHQDPAQARTLDCRIERFCRSRRNPHATSKHRSRR
jgi:hypothetical protein